MVAVQHNLAGTKNELAKQVAHTVKLAQAVEALGKPHAFAVLAGFAGLTENPPNYNLADTVNVAEWEGQDTLSYAACHDCGWLVVGESGSGYLQAASNAHAKAYHKGKHGMGSVFGFKEGLCGILWPYLASLPWTKHS